MPDWKTLIAARFPKLQMNPAREKEILDEFSQHLDDRFRELRSEGKAEHEAIRLTIGEIDNAALEREMKTLRQSFDSEPIAPGAPAGHLTADIGRDVVYAIRTLCRQPGFALAAILTLALGIGVNTAIFSLVNAMLLRHLPVQNRERLVYLYSGQNLSVLSYPAYRTLRDNNQSMEKLVAWGGIQASLNAEDETDLVSGAIVTGNFFEALGVRPERGRLLGMDDDVTPGAHPVAVISDRLWRSRFAERADIVGHEIRLNGKPFTIVGITPPEFPSAQLGVNRDLYVPMMMQALMRPPRAGYSGEMNPDLLNNPNNGWLYNLGLLKPTVTVVQAAEELSAVATSYAQSRSRNARPQQVTLVPIDNGDPAQRQQMRSAATLLIAVVGTILVIACANVANLLLSKAVSRRRELAVRLAVGANRWRIVRQLLTESILLSLTGGAAGIGLAFAIVQAFKVAAPPAGVLPVALEFSIDLRVLLFTFVLSFVTGIVFGLLPALQASNPNVAPTLKDESFVPDERGRRIRMKQSLVVCEIALTVVLLVAAGLFIRSLRKSQQVDPGIASNELLSAPLNINLLRYTRPQGRDFYKNVIDRVSALPGVVSASVARVAVLTGSGRISTINIEGRQPPNDPRTSESRGISAVESDTASANVVSPEFLNTFGIALVQGRTFNMDDAENHPLVAVVSETFVRRFFPNGDALGKRFSTAAGQNPDWTEIVGIAHDSKYGSLSEDPQPVVYLPIRQRHETGVTLYVRTSTSPDNLIASVRHEIQQLEPNLPVPDIQTMNQTIAASLYVPRMAAWLIGILGGLAMVLTSLGVYGVLSFAISRRTRELGIRMALGADSRKVLRLVIKEGMLLLAIGLALGMTGATFFSMTLSSFLFGVDTHDLMTFVTVPVVLTFVAFAACYLPARRAVGVDPMKAIREV
jgi:predicted permease